MNLICCACEKNFDSVGNIITLEKRTLQTPGGWGCFICGLPPEGAIAVICDDCAETNAEIRFACLGDPAAKDLIQIGLLTEDFKHDLRFHLDEIQNTDFADCRHCRRVTAVGENLECRDCGKTRCLICGENNSSVWVRTGVCGDCGGA